MSALVPCTIPTITLGAAILAGCFWGCASSSPEPKTHRSGVSSRGGLFLETSAGFSGELSRDAGDTVLTMGRIAPTKVVASTKKGYAFLIDTEAGSVTKQNPILAVKDPNSYLFTVSKKYVWEFAVAAGTVGRNKNAAGSAQVSINKATIKDLIPDPKLVVPVAATEDQLYLLGNDNIVVFTWADGALGRQKIRTNRSFDADELIMGAGALNLESPDSGLWLATSKRLMIYRAGTWTEQAFSTSSTGGTIEYVSLYFKSESDTQPSDSLIGLLDSGRLTSMSLVAGKPNTVAGGKATPADGGQN